MKSFKVNRSNGVARDEQDFPDSLARNVKKSESEKYFILDDYNVTNFFPNSLVINQPGSETYLQSKTPCDEERVPIYEELPDQDLQTPFYISEHNTYKVPTSHQFNLSREMHDFPLQNNCSSPQLSAIRENIITTSLEDDAMLRTEVQQQQQQLSRRQQQHIVPKKNPSHSPLFTPVSGHNKKRFAKGQKNDWNFELPKNFSPSNRRKVFQTDHDSPVFEGKRPGSTTPLTLSLTCNNTSYAGGLGGTPQRDSEGRKNMPDPDEILPLEAWTDFSCSENWSESLTMTYRKRKKDAKRLRGYNRDVSQPNDAHHYVELPVVDDIQSKVLTSFSSSSNDSSAQR